MKKDITTTTTIKLARIFLEDSFLERRKRLRRRPKETNVADRKTETNSQMLLESSCQKPTASSSPGHFIFDSSPLVINTGLSSEKSNLLKNQLQCVDQWIIYLLRKSMTRWSNFCRSTLYPEKIRLMTHLACLNDEGWGKKRGKQWLFIFWLFPQSRTRAKEGNSVSIKVS